MSTFTLLPATSGEFVGREDILAEMLATLKDEKSRMGFALYGKRRVGKTSILRELTRRLSKDKKIVPIYFSLLDLTDKSLVAFARELSTAILDTYRSRLGIRFKAKELIQLPFATITNLLKDIKLDLEVKTLITMSLSREKNTPVDPDTLVNNLFDLPEKLARQTKTKCVLFLDEFPEIMTLKHKDNHIGSDLIGKIRTLMEEKRYLCLNISGSIRKTMVQITLSPNSAFYRQFIIKLIEPLNQDNIKRLLLQNLPEKNISADALDIFFAETDGFPFYAQFIGRTLKFIPHKNINAKDIQNAINEFLRQEGNIIFREEFFSFSDTERKILLAMTHHRITNPGEIAKELSASSSLIAKALGYLQDKGIVEKKDKGVYAIEDPVFEKWIATINT